MREGKCVYRKDLIPMFAKRTGMTQKKAEEVLDTFQDMVAEFLCEGTAVYLTGFGIFSVRRKKERLVRNLRTMEGCVTPERFKPEFKASKKLKKLVDQKIKENTNIFSSEQ